MQEIKQSLGVPFVGSLFGHANNEHVVWGRNPILINQPYINDLIFPHNTRFIPVIFIFGMLKQLILKNQG